MKDYFGSKGWLTKYSQAEDSTGVWQKYVAEVQRSEMDNFNTPDLDQGADSILRPGETLDDFDVTFRKPNAQGGRIGFALAGSVDRANNVKKGQDLGRGVTQRNRNGKIVYNLTSFGSKEFMKENKIKFPSFNNPKDAVSRRAELVKKFGDPQNLKDYKGDKNYKRLVEKNPKFKDYWKDQVATNKTIKKVVDSPKYQGKNKLNSLEEIFNAVLEETRITESVRKGNAPSRLEKQLISGKALENLINTFEFSYLPNLGTIDTKKMGELLGLSDGELSKLMANIDKPYPKTLLSNSPEISRIDKALSLKNKLADFGITYDRTNVNISKGIDTTKEGSYRFKVDDARIKELSKDKSFSFEKKIPKLNKGDRKLIISESKKSDDYIKYGYGADNNAVETLRSSLNNNLTTMSDKELLKFIEKNPKLKNLVTLQFDPSKPEMFTNQILKDMDIDLVRQNVNFEVDHIQGVSTVTYDADNKKLLNSLGLQSPKNLYIIPKGLNTSVKQRVENYVADNPSNKKQIKIIDDYFKTNKISYWNRDLKKYGGHTPIDTGTGLGQIGIEDKQSLKKILTGTYINLKGEKKYIADNPDKLIENVNELNRTKVAMNYIEGKTDFIGVSSGFNTDLISEDLKKIVNSEVFKTFKAKIANPALKTAVGVAKLPTKVFGAADLVLGYFDYTNNRQKGFSKEDSTKHMVDAILFGATSFGKETDIEGVRKMANKNGMSNEVFNNLMAVNTNQKKFMDTVSKSKAKFNESMNIIESGAADPTAENMLIQKLKVDTKKSLTNTMENIVKDSRSLETNLQVQEAGAPININVDKEKAFSDLGSSSREFVQNRIDASDPKVFEQGDTTMGKIGSTIKNTLMQPDFYTGFFKKTGAQKKEEDMQKLKIQDPTLYYKMLQSEGIDPRINLNIPVQLEFEQKYPQFGNQMSDALTQNKAEGGIIGLRSKYEYKK